MQTLDISFVLIYNESRFLLFDTRMEEREMSWLIALSSFVLAGFWISVGFEKAVWDFRVVGWVVYHLSAGIFFVLYALWRRRRS